MVLWCVVHSITVARVRSCSVTVLGSMGSPSMQTATDVSCPETRALLLNLGLLFVLQVVLFVASFAVLLAGLLGGLRVASIAVLLAVLLGVVISWICASTRSRVSCEGPSTSMVEVWWGVTTVMTTVLCMALILIRKMLCD